jgi:ZIP family zinc transporter
MSVVTLGTLGSLIASLGTTLGALPALFLTRASDKTLNVLLGAAAGVMLATTAFGLVGPAIDIADGTWPGWGIWAVSAGMLLGAIFLDRADAWLPHEHFLLGREGPDSSWRRIWLFVIAVTIHNFPEGLSVGVGFGQEDFGHGVAIATGIGLQDIPEGLCVALPLMALGYSRWRAVAIASLTGFAEPIGGLLGSTAIYFFRWLLPFAMAFAGGAMLFVITEEVIPETHRKGQSRIATFGLMLGFVIMMIMDKLLG